MILFLLVCTFALDSVTCTAANESDRKEIKAEKMVTGNDLVHNPVLVNHQQEQIVQMERDRREANVEKCKYKKGNWSTCNKTLMVSYKG